MRQVLGKWHPKWTVTKFHDTDDTVAKWKANGHSAFETAIVFKDKVFEIKKFEFNGLTQTGANLIWNLLINNLTTIPFNNVNARLGASADTTAFFETQTNLNPSNSSTYYMQIMDAGYPQISASPGTQLIFESTFNSTTALMEWQSFGVDNDGIDGPGTTITSYFPNTIGLLNRYVQDVGTKVAGDTWILTLVLEIT